MLIALKQADVAVSDNADLVCNMTDPFQFPFLSNFASMDIAHFGQHVFSYLNFVRCKLTFKHNWYAVEIIKVKV